MPQNSGPEAHTTVRKITTTRCQIPGLLTGFFPTLSKTDGEILRLLNGGSLDTG